MLPLIYENIDETMFFFEWDWFPTFYGESSLKHFYDKIGRQVGIDFWLILGWILVPKIDKNRHRIDENREVDVKKSQHKAEEVQDEAQESQDEAQEGQEGHQEAIKSRQEAKKRPTRDPMNDLGG